MRVLLSLLLVVLASRALAAEDEKISQGAALFESRCAGVCHQIPDVEQLTEKQWQVVLNTMQLRMKQFGMAPLNAEEYETILYYLASQAK